MCILRVAAGCVLVCLRRVRAAYKAVQNPKDLERELPQCALGSMLLTWIKQVTLGETAPR